jgi:hypothetical protein
MTFNLDIETGQGGPKRDSRQRIEMNRPVAGNCLNIPAV